MELESKYLRWRWIVSGILCLLLVISAAWIGYRVVRMKKNAQFQEMVWSYGGMVDFRNFAPRVTYTANDVAEKIGLHRLEAKFRTSRPTGGGFPVHPDHFDFRQLATIPELLLFNGSPDISEEEMRTLLDFQSITTIEAPVNTFSDLHVRVFAGLSNLESLGLVGTATTDAGVAELMRAEKLTTLDLSRCNISDESIPHLLEMENLRTLRIKHTAITLRGLRNLITKHPSLRQVVIDLETAGYRNTASFHDLNPRITVVIEP